MQGYGILNTQLEPDHQDVIDAREATAAFYKALGDEEQAKQADDLMALLTPIGKAFVTETGYEAANIGVQVYGGHGFIKEWGMEQIVRDARISMLYEGTTGIQALDLLGRKVLGSGGKLLLGFTGMIDELCAANAGEENADFTSVLKSYKDEWLELSMKIGESAMENPDEAGVLRRFLELVRSADPESKGEGQSFPARDWNTCTCRNGRRRRRAMLKQTG